MLSKWSVKKPYTIFVAVILIAILGTISFMNLQTDLLPSLELPYVVVVTPYPGASPEEVETVVTRPLEQVLATTTNIKNVSSVSRESSSMIILEFNSTSNMDSVMIEVNSNLDMIKGNWGEEVGSPMVIKANPEMLPIMVAAVDMEGKDTREVSEFTEEVLIPDMESMEGVASVEGTGLVEEKIEVKLLQEKIDEINAQMLAVVDGELVKAESDLKKAKKELESGLAKLDEEYANQSKQLSDGMAAINEGKIQLEEGEAALLEAREQLNSQLAPLQLALRGLEAAETELLEQQEALEALEVRTPEQETALEAIRRGLEETQTQKAEMEDSIQLLTQGLAEIEAQLAALQEGKQEIFVREDQISQGRIVLSQEIGNARTQMVQGLAQIEEGLAELEKAKEEAFEKTDLGAMITTDMIGGILMAQNFSMPAGYVQGEDGDFLVKIGDSIADVEEMRNLLLFDTKMDEVGKIYLSEVAEVELVDNAADLYAKVNGEDAVMLTFQKQSNYSTAQVAKTIRDRIDKVMDEHEGTTITPLMDQGVYIDIVIDSVLKNLMYGGILAILILLLFLRDIRPTLIVAMSIPTSLVFAITMMYFTGVTINIISLGGLALGVGMLVDNSVVVIENVYRLKNQGVSAFKASIEGARQVAGALTASTLTTTAVFLPVVFTQGISRQIFTDMGLTIAYSLLASLIVALTLVPVLSSGIFRNLESREHGMFDRFVGFYEKLLRGALKFKVVVIVLVVALLGGSIFAAFSMGTAFIPEMDGTEMSLTIDMDPSATFEERTAMSDQVIEKIMDVEGIETIGAFTGGTAMGFGGGGGGNISLYLLLNENKSRTNQEISQEILDRTADLDAEIAVSTSNMNLGGLAGEGMEVIVTGRDLDSLRTISDDVAELLAQTEGMVNVETSFVSEAMEIRVIVDKEKAMGKGLTVAQVFQAVSSSISAGRQSTVLLVENKEFPVIVVDDKSETVTRENLGELEIPFESEGEKSTVRLDEIADLQETEGLQAIRRDAQQRYVSVTGDLLPDYNIGLVSRELEKKLVDYDVPEGYDVRIAGETETINDTLGDLTLMILLAIVFVYLIMVAQFQSLLFPFIVMFTIPLAFTGGFLALFFTGTEISVISMLGFLVLSGVVVNNGIVFVDYTNQLMEEGMEKKEALLEAGRVRIRPILMTAITTILGLSTLSFGMGMGAEMLQPLAITAIGGLTYATLLTLFVVPVMYDLFQRKSHINKAAMEE
ncbi:efflux RND transporter permease subunit [Alkalibacter rhizosphaerae]|uniref:Efflux RND transporter permease subunit n=1 Tax=Alkalibacter rhizosphaerae TaxID=2815577 RepID=A0A975AHZ1_9FIRM|nr:efflux RND transporter permease subunit [Alkalibacter rhizosphaerae]QSX07990.1 efflux RND transporter permease subunit [Alkalibacter rhizosphaerae]